MALVISVLCSLTLVIVRGPRTSGFSAVIPRFLPSRPQASLIVWPMLK